MAKVSGIGGIFFKSADAKKLYEWYEKHLGIAGKPDAGAMFPWRRADGGNQEEITVWSIFPETTKYFKDSKADFMMNYIVDDLDSMLAELRAAGVAVDDKVESHEYGKFGWITDPDGNRIELWQPR
jgi:predicted enzyme related to lactoylglutathione lyase